MTVTYCLVRRPTGLFALTGSPLRWEPCTEGPTHTAWERLAGVRQLDEVRDEVARVLRDTILDPESTTSATLPAPRAQRARRTAAHPRGYCGTIARPPKRPAPPILDLRTVLCSPVGVRELERRLFGAARVQLPQRHACLPRDLQRALEWLPARPRLLPLVMGLLSEGDADLLEPVLHVLVTSPDPAPWLLGLLDVAPAERLERARELRARGVAERAVEPDVVRWLFELSDARREQVLEVFEQPLRRQALREGWAVVDHFGVPRTLRLLEREVVASEGVHRALIDFVERLLPEGPAERRADLAVRSWQDAVCLPRASVWFERLSVCGLTGAAGEKAAQVCLGVLDVRASSLETMLGVLDAFLERICAALAACPPTHLWKAGSCLTTVYELPDPVTGLRRALAWLPHVVDPGTGAGTSVCEVVGALAGFDVELPARVWRRLDHAARRENDAWCLARGLKILCERDLARTQRGLIEATTPTLRAAKALGTLSTEVARRVAAGVEVPNAEDLSPAELIRWAGPDASRRLRQHVFGERALKPAQRDRDLARARAAWPRVWARAVGEAVGGVLGDEPRVRHARQLAPFAGCRRRGLRRLLRGADPRQHPNNRVWLCGRTQLDVGRWCGTFRLGCRVPGLGWVTLEVEQDPLEALRLGTYAGTCLGVGGSFADSALAIVWDVNKQVVFARRDGAVIARQVLAVSEEETLVPYGVYPLESPLENAFRAFDRAYAAWLGLPLVRGDEDVAELTGRGWWDDGVWEVDSA